MLSIELDRELAKVATKQQLRHHLFVLEFPLTMAASRLTWPITKPDSCLMATVGRQDLPNLTDRPYHSDVKVVIPE